MLEKLELKNISLSCKPSMHNFPTWKETLSDFSYTFSPGKVYAIISEPGRGGWAISYLLAGRVRSYAGSLLVNQKLANSRTLKTYGWYVGEAHEPSAITSLFRQKTIRQQLQSYTSNNHMVDELIDRFELSPSRLDRQMKHISNERWNASAAIGLGQEKQIFCFPWMDDIWKNAIRARLRLCSEILRQQNGMVIIPTSSLLIVDDFVDEIIYV
ncbi:hypothetical protein ABEW34_11850 [Paenibacillus algorifonticola]|uniref:hypothetical protein n=1 Tax=Paenibacillus algorifonticola TaxID=684063 RepID=UPI003D2C8BC3